MSHVNHICVIKPHAEFFHQERHVCAVSLELKKDEGELDLQFFDLAGGYVFSLYQQEFFAALGFKAAFYIVEERFGHDLACFYGYAEAYADLFKRLLIIFLALL